MPALGARSRRRTARGPRPSWRARPTRTRREGPEQPSQATRGSIGRRDCRANPTRGARSDHGCGRSRPSLSYRAFCGPGSSTALPGRGSPRRGRAPPGRTRCRRRKRRNPPTAADRTLCSEPCARRSRSVPARRSPRREGTPAGTWPPSADEPVHRCGSGCWQAGGRPLAGGIYTPTEVPVIEPPTCMWGGPMHAIAAGPHTSPMIASCSSERLTCSTRSAIYNEFRSV